jgi:hypothetical protein
VDTKQPRVANAGWFSRFRHYTNIDKCLPRLERLIDDFSFGTMGESLSNLQITQEIAVHDLL